MTQVGRPQGELKGETPQANDLAQWLRTLTRGVSQRDLAQLLHIGKTLCSEYLNGSKLIPEDMIGQLVDAYVTDNRLREQRKAAGHLRRQRAVEAAQGKPSMPPLSQRARTDAAAAHRRRRQRAVRPAGLLGQDRSAEHQVPPHSRTRGTPRERIPETKSTRRPPGAVFVKALTCRSRGGLDGPTMPP
ncbi:helix-turn-helix domain-containing protein [Streptomyces rochei]|uniref:helix-turn-helix domain-containing protein n=1 Tax=Streptomyces rochei TaxID=1928 RepID=UPI0013BAB576|nr:helix-turn-helix transcriptional regulator [Streptomyces rochei]NEC70956.1 helix-turn-helix transcriptional regulator [Streptomyces rochei]